MDQSSQFSDFKQPLCINHQNILILWCKQCYKPLCQKCVVEHSNLVYRKQHLIIEFGTLTDEVKDEATELYGEYQKLLLTLELEFNLLEQQKQGLQIIKQYEQMILSEIQQYFDQIRNTLIQLTSNNTNMTQKEQLQHTIQGITNQLSKFQNNDIDEGQVHTFYENNYKKKLQQMKEQVTDFIEKSKNDFKRPNFKIKEEFLKEIPFILANYMSISLEKIQLQRIPKPRQTIIIPSDRTPGTIGARKSGGANTINLTQSQLLNHTFTQVLSLEQKQVTHIEEEQEIKKIVVLEQSKVQYLHQLIDSQRLFLHEISRKQNQLIYLPKSAQIPLEAVSAISSDLILYISGGILDNQKSNKFYSFSNNNGLQQLQNMQLELIHHTLVITKGCVYVIGGKSEQGAVSNCNRYNLHKKQWENMQPLNQARSHHGCCVFETEDYINIYVLFGIDLEGNAVNTIEKYSQQDRKWTILELKNMIPGIAYMKPCSIQLDLQNILIFGGFYKGQQLQQSNKAILLNTINEHIDNLGQILPYLGSVAGQPTTFQGSVYSLQNCSDSRIPVYSEFVDIFQILEISDIHVRIDEIINCRYLNLKKV